MQQPETWPVPEQAQAQAQIFTKGKQGTLFYFCGKRALDFVLVATSLALLFPLMLIIAILIKLDSKGPAIFKQERVGAKRRRCPDGTYEWERQNFTIFKFRTMRTDSSANIHQDFMKAVITGDQEKMSKFQHARKENAGAKMDVDPRITRVGAFLRKTSLDELPQLWNVLIGDMSLVGPRPPIPYEVEVYKPWHLQRLKATPGVTGLWQVSGRSTTGFDEMVELDIEYIESQSLWFDIKILLGTIPAVLMQRGAY